ncbi:MAG: HDOD domain-containing protein [Phycisphaeraceae bacterium]|nr:HDOD domain-containing protein [Phycisphaeraceae bacterium]
MDDFQVNHHALDRLIRRIDHVSTLPHVVTRVIEVAQSTHTSAADLARVIETAPVLSVRLLKCVNSAAFGLSRRVTSIQHAISYLGFKQVCNLAIGSAVSQIFKNEEPQGTYTRRGLWQHLVSVAVISRMIAIRRSIDAFEDAFLAGLLHDIGIILEDQYMHAQFAEMMRRFPEDRTLIEAERERFGFDHTHLGDRVAEAWRLPDFVRSVIRLHHEPEAAYDKQCGALLGCVQLADVLCTLKGISSIGVKRVRLAPAALEALGLDREDMQVITEDMAGELGQHRELLDIVEAV